MRTVRFERAWREGAAWLVLLLWLASNVDGIRETLRRLEAQPDPMRDAPTVEQLAPFFGGLTIVDFVTEAGHVREIRRRYYAAQYALTPVALRGPWVGGQKLTRIVAQEQGLEAAICFCRSPELRRIFESEMTTALSRRGSAPDWLSAGDWLAVRGERGR